LSLEGKGSVWELTVVTQDKPFLFSNICGVLASFGMDILRGHAMTTPSGLVLDAFQFTDQERYLALNPGAVDHVRQVLSDVIAGTANLASRLNGREQSVLNRRAPRIAPLVHCDNQSSQRYSILDINADNGLGLLYRISRLISQKRCEIDLVLISTEGHKAIDVFHITRAGAKLSDKALQRLAGDLQRLLEGHNEVT
jgi:[protein-PII] uridylyltransferase